jgi:hypothetical protein
MADGGGTGGAGAGYNIPISVSYARTDTTNPILNASTTFNFSSPWASGGTNDQTSRLADSATATSSAAEGNAASAAQSATSIGADGSSAQPSALSSIPTWAYIAGGIAVLALIWFTRK